MAASYNIPPGYRSQPSTLSIQTSVFFLSNQDTSPLSSQLSRLPPDLTDPRGQPLPKSGDRCNTELTPNISSFDRELRLLLRLTPTPGQRPEVEDLGLLLNSAQSATATQSQPQPNPIWP